MLPCGRPFDPVVLACSSHSLLNRQLLHSLLVKVSIHYCRSQFQVRPEYSRVLLLGVSWNWGHLNVLLDWSF